MRSSVLPILDNELLRNFKDSTDERLIGSSANDELLSK